MSIANLFFITAETQLQKKQEKSDSGDESMQKPTSSQKQLLVSKTSNTVSTSESNQAEAHLDIPTMQRKFATIVGRTLKSFEGRIKESMLAQTVLSLGAYEPVKTSEKLLLEDHEDEIQNANSNSDIFNTIRPYMSFFNPEVLGTIIEALGTKEDTDAYDKYMRDLEAFCKTMVVPPCNLSDNQDPVKNQEIVKIKLDLKDRRLKRIRDIKSAIAKILNVSVMTIQIVKVRKGCLEVTFLVHGEVITQLSKLSCTQEWELHDLGMLTLEFGDQLLDLKVASVRMVIIL